MTQQEKINPKNARLFIISSRRPQNVAKMKELIGNTFPITWIVRDMIDLESYMKYDNIVVGIGGRLSESRNQAIECAFSNQHDCIMVEDDLVNIQLCSSKNYHDNKSIDFQEAIRIMYDAFTEIPYCYLCGVAPTNNAFYYNPQRPISINKFVIGSLIIIRYNTPLRFDTNLSLKEDYDYTLQHITHHGGAIRCDNILATFNHYSNKGGAVDYRTPELETKTINHLKHKWGSNIIKDNPRRLNEIILNTNKIS